MTQGDPYEELAALFLTPADGASASAAVTARTKGGRPTMELVLVGHLPVRAALWLAPFAAAVARERGLTALVRLDGEEPLVQVFGGAGDPMRSGACRNLRETILFLGRTVRTWLVRPSARSDAAAMLAMCPTRVTVLSGTDEAALVHAYRLIRQLHDAAEAAGTEMPEVDLAVLGSDEAAAGDMIARLNRTAEAWSTRPMKCRLVLPRIDASVRSSGLRSFSDQLPPDLGEVATWIDLGRAQFHQDSVTGSSAEPAVVHGSVPLRVSDDDVVDSDPEPDDPVFRGSPVVDERGDSFAARRTGARPVNEASAARAAEPAAEKPRADTVSQPPFAGATEGRSHPVRHGRPEPLEDAVASRSAAFFEAKAPADPIEEIDERGAPIPLSSRVPGLTALAFRMPGQEHAELAVDAGGRVHVLMRDEHLRSAAVIQSWIRSHREILALAAREHAIDPAGRSDVHLFTDQPLRVADLHGSAYHLHLLARVPAGRGHVFVSMPLGRPAPRS